MWALAHLSEAPHITISTWAPKAEHTNFDEVVLKAVRAASLPPPASVRIVQLG